MQTILLSKNLLGKLYNFIIIFVLFLIFTQTLLRAEIIREKLDKTPEAISFTDRNGTKIDPTSFEQLDFIKSNSLPNNKTIQLTLDIKANKILDEEVTAGIEKYKPVGAGAVLIDVETGEIIAISSKYINERKVKFNADGDARFNMITEGVYEIGSIAKLLTIVNAVEQKIANADTKIDARKPLHLGKYEIGDYHATNRILTLDEAFLHSSNIAISKLAIKIGRNSQKEFMQKIGFTEKPSINFMELTAPIFSQTKENNSKLITATLGFGHGFAVSPLQAVCAMSTFVNGGYLIEPSIIKKEANETQKIYVISESTSSYIRHLLEMNVEKGSGLKAKVDGIKVGGQTSTAEKNLNGHYIKDKLFSTYISAFPIDKPRYVLMTLLDEPKPLAETYGFATAGWNAAPIAGEIIKKLTPILKLDSE